MDFKNKVVLVTGASAGIGEDTAILFAKHGASVAIVGRSADNLRRVAALCDQLSSGRTLTIAADLGTDQGVDKVVNDTLNHFGRLDVLVNNAALGCRTSLLTDPDMSNFDKMFNVNVRGVYNLTRQLAPALIQTKGNIVNVSSIAATVVNVGSLPYGMSKAALNHFSSLIALELAPKGVRVNTVSPGFTETKFMERATKTTASEATERYKDIENIVPMKKNCSGLDIARAIVFLASDENRLTTGALLKVDGGLDLSGIPSLTK